jgi:hypothetical protein
MNHPDTTRAILAMALGSLHIPRRSYRTAQPLRDTEPEPRGPTPHDLARIEAARLKRERKAPAQNTHPAEPKV